MPLLRPVLSEGFHYDVRHLTKGDTVWKWDTNCHVVAVHLICDPREVSKTEPVLDSS